MAEMHREGVGVLTSLMAFLQLFESLLHSQSQIPGSVSVPLLGPRGINRLGFHFHPLMHPGIVPSCVC